MRGLFFILVFISHGCDYKSPELQTHWVNPIVQFGTVHDTSLVLSFFFVMSSFIITMLLLREKQFEGQVHIGAFYLRRLLRIAPLYLVMLGIGFGLYPWLRSFGSHPYTEVASLWHHLVFIQNFDFVERMPEFLGLSVLWSLAVEEQFYLVWPLLLALVPRRALFATFLGILAAVLAWQCTHDLSPFHTLTCASDLAVGGLAAVAVFHAHQYRHPLARRWLLAVRHQSPVLIVALWLAAIYLYRHGLRDAPAMVQPFERLVVDIVAVSVLLEQNYGRKSLFKLGYLPGFRKLGQLAYGLYLLHAVAIVAVDDVLHLTGLPKTVWNIVLLKPVLAFALTVLGAMVSFRYFELPFLRLYGKLLPAPPKASATATVFIEPDLIPATAVPAPLALYTSTAVSSR
ncbi:acyltransferase [Microvirga sp. STR05]|uniref:Acyltransferase n=1 Tax=Hymenobacter duratus TaxID=2771356 RepID=A0ABR8JLM4_9BACT|nr:acyltransferase [Hymenobacter duratus]MBR7951408.1 acyltransferase [Microvirga sp. STR05]